MFEVAAPAHSANISSRSIADPEKAPTKKAAHTNFHPAPASLAPYLDMALQQGGTEYPRYVEEDRDPYLH